MSLSVNISGDYGYTEWRDAVPYVNVNGTWKACTQVYVNVEDVWKPILGGTGQVVVAYPKPYTFTVPAGVTSVSFVARGGAGGKGGNSRADGVALPTVTTVSYYHYGYGDVSSDTLWPWAVRLGWIREGTLYWENLYIPVQGGMTVAFKCDDQGWIRLTDFDGQTQTVSQGDYGVVGLTAPFEIDINLTTIVKIEINYDDIYGVNWGAECVIRDSMGNILWTTMEPATHYIAPDVVPTTVTYTPYTNTTYSIYWIYEPVSLTSTEVFYWAALNIPVTSGMKVYVGGHLGLGKMRLYDQNGNLFQTLLLNVFTNNVNGEQTLSDFASEISRIEIQQPHGSTGGHIVNASGAVVWNTRMPATHHVPETPKTNGKIGYKGYDGTLLRGTIPVNPHDVLVFAPGGNGGAGTNRTSGGTGGSYGSTSVGTKFYGGAGGKAGTDDDTEKGSGSGGGGGGASLVYLNDQLVAVAGGGGGGGGAGCLGPGESKEGNPKRIGIVPYVGSSTNGMDGLFGDCPGKDNNRSGPSGGGGGGGGGYPRGGNGGQSNTLQSAALFDDVGGTSGFPGETWLDTTKVATPNYNGTLGTTQLDQVYRAGVIFVSWT